MGYKLKCLKGKLYCPSSETSNTSTKNYAYSAVLGFLILVASFFSLAGREFPFEPMKILPFFDFLSPLPIIV